MSYHNARFTCHDDDERAPMPFEHCIEKARFYLNQWRKERLKPNNGRVLSILKAQFKGWIHEARRAKRHV